MDSMLFSLKVLVAEETAYYVSAPIHICKTLNNASMILSEALPSP